VRGLVRQIALNLYGRTCIQSEGQYNRLVDINVLPVGVDPDEKICLLAGFCSGVAASNHFDLDWLGRVLLAPHHHGRGTYGDLTDLTRNQRICVCDTGREAPARTHLELGASRRTVYRKPRLELRHPNIRWVHNTGYGNREPDRVAQPDSSPVDGSRDTHVGPRRRQRAPAQKCYNQSNALTSA